MPIATLDQDLDDDFQLLPGRVPKFDIQLRKNRIVVAQHVVDYHVAHWAYT